MERESGVVAIQIKGLDRIQSMIKKYPKISEDIFQRAIDGSQAQLAKRTLKDDPVPWRTGMLTQTFEFKSERLQARWFPTRNYAYYVEKGTTNKDGSVRMVARPYMQQIIDKAQPDIDKLFEGAMDRVLQKIAQG
jgi:hypothetical protein